MSNKIKNMFYAFMILFITGTVFTGCTNSSIESETPKTGTGYFVLTLDGADTDTLRAKTILPGTPSIGDFVRYKLVFDPRGTNSNSAQTLDNLTATTVLAPVNLPVGAWNLVVYAYKNVGDLDTEPTAQGSLLNTIDIKDGGTTAGAVTLTTDILSGTGTFTWTISWSGVTVSTATMTITPVNGGTTITIPTITNGTKGTQNDLNSGYYRIFVELTNSTGQKAGLREILQVHRNLTSNFTPAAFTAANFFAALSGTVTISPNTGSAIPIGIELTATYTGNGTNPSYQWKNSGGTVVSTNQKYTPNIVGTYTVTVSAAGYNGSATGTVNTTNLGAIWTPVTIPTFGISDIWILSYNEKFFAVERSVMGLGGNKIAYSTNGTSWDDITTNILYKDPGATNDPWLQAMTYGGGVFVASTYTGLSYNMKYSTDGATWNFVNTPPIGLVSFIIYGGDRFVAKGWALGSTHIEYSSDGGKNWSNAFLGEMMGGTLVSCDSIVYGKDKFVASARIDDGAVVSNKIAYSTDGCITWTGVASPIGNCEQLWIEYCNEKFFAIGYNPLVPVKMAYSTDGMNWTPIAQNPFFNKCGDIHNITYGNGKFLVMGGTIHTVGDYRPENFLAYSVDGINWTEITNPLGSKYTLDITFGNGIFVISGSDTSGYPGGPYTNGKIAYSVDCITWVTVDTSTLFGTNEIFPIAYGNGKFIVGGTNGKMAISAP